MLHTRASPRQLRYADPGACEQGGYLIRCRRVKAAERAACRRSCMSLNNRRLSTEQHPSPSRRAADQVSRAVQAAPMPRPRSVSVGQPLRCPRAAPPCLRRPSGSIIGWRSGTTSHRDHEDPPLVDLGADQPSAQVSGGAVRRFAGIFARMSKLSASRSSTTENTKINRSLLPYRVVHSASQAGAPAGRLSTNSVLTRSAASPRPAPPGTRRH